MQIDAGSGPLNLVLAVVAALFAAVVAWKSLEYVRMDIRRRRENPPPPDGDPGADA